MDFEQIKSRLDPASIEQRLYAAEKVIGDLQHQLDNLDYKLERFEFELRTIASHIEAISIQLNSHKVYPLHREG